MEIDDAIADLKAASLTTTDIEGFRTVRAFVSSASFREYVRNAVQRFHDELDERKLLLDSLSAIRFGFRDVIAERDELHRQISALALGGGSGLAVGSIIGAAQILAYPPLALFPILLGLYAAWRGSLENRRLALEVSILNDIVAELDRHIRFVESGAEMR